MSSLWRHRFEEAKVSMAMSEFRTIYNNKWPECIVINRSSRQPKRVIADTSNAAWWATGFSWNESNRRQILQQVCEYGERHGLIYYGSKIIEKALRVSYVSKDAPQPYSDFKDFKNHYLYIVYFPLIEISGEQNMSVEPRVPWHMKESEGGRWNVSIKLQAPLYAPISGMADGLGIKEIGSWRPDYTFTIDRPGWDERNLREILEKVRVIVNDYDCDLVAVPSAISSSGHASNDSFSVLAHDRRTGLNTYFDFARERIEKDEPKGYLSKGSIYKLGECQTSFPEDTEFPWCETKLNSHGFPIYHIGEGKYVSQEFINKWFPIEENRVEAKCLYNVLNDGSACITMMNCHRSMTPPYDSYFYWKRYEIRNELRDEYQECSNFDLWETGRWNPHNDGESMDKCLESALESLDKMGCALVGKLEFKRLSGSSSYDYKWVVNTIDKYTGELYRVFECKANKKECGSFGTKYTLPGFSLSSQLRSWGALTPEEEHQLRLQEAAKNEEPVAEETSSHEIDASACKWWFDAHYDDLDEMEGNIDKDRCFYIPASMLVGVSRPALIEALSKLAYKYSVVKGLEDGSIQIQVAEPVSDDDIEVIAQFDDDAQGLANYIAANDKFA